MSLKKVLLSLMCMLGITGCTSAPENDYSKLDSTNYRAITRARWNKITLNVHWLSLSEIQIQCERVATKDKVTLAKDINGCARSNPDDLNICEIYIEQPKTFNDANRLQILGHEVWHCLGAKHESGY